MSKPSQSLQSQSAHRPSLTLLILDDDRWIKEELKEFFQNREGFTVHVAALPSKAIALLEAHRPDIFILDIKLPEMDGLTLLKQVKGLYPNMEVIMITGHGDMENAIKALRSGASDFLTKPFRLHEIEMAVARTEKYLSLVRQMKSMESSHALLNQSMKKKMGTPLITTSPAMTHVLSSMKKVASAHDTSVLITGESGTGKELVAQGIHALSVRNSALFCAVNTSAVTESLFESEFFGHKKGAFTHAISHRQGWFETANKGTLFLDEISEMPSSCQAKLLRVLEERRITRVGEQQSVPVDLRIVAASNRDLTHGIEAGSFRRDLYYRLNAFSIHIPSLRDRKEDIAPLTEHFIIYFTKKLKRPCLALAPDVMPYLFDYPFPGNVRELKNMVERAVILCDDNNTLTLDHFPGIERRSPLMVSYNTATTTATAHATIQAPPLNPTMPSTLSGQTTHSEETTHSKENPHPDPIPHQKGIICPEQVTHLDETLRQVEKEILETTLEAHRYNKSKAAKALNISRQSLHRRLKKVGLLLSLLMLLPMVVLFSKL